MTNKVTESIPDLQVLGAKMKSAAENPEVGVPMVINTSANIGTDADALTTTRNNHEQGKVVLANSRTTLLSVIMAVRVFIALGRDMLKPIFGNLYSEAYDVLGFTTSSLKIPQTAEELLPMLQAYKAFYVANPLRENAASDLTAVHAQLLYDQLNAANNNVNVKKAQEQSLKDARDVASAQMQKRIRNVIKELEMQLDPLDQRWIAFGLNRPGAIETPDAPLNLSAILIGPNAAAIKWNASARADYYRVFKKVHGTDDDYIAVGSPADLDFTIEELPLGTQIEIVVTAVNAGGESVYSQKVTITTQS